MGASIYFRLNSDWIITSSIFGIIFGGLINGILNEGRIQTANALFVFGAEKFISIGSKFSQSRPFASNGSITTAFWLFFYIFLKFLR